jgi:hypothetical protein
VDLSLDKLTTGRRKRLNHVALSEHRRSGAEVLIVVNKPEEVLKRFARAQFTAT